MRRRDATLPSQQHTQEKKMSKQSKRSVEQVVAAISALDLEPIKFKLMDAEEGEGWSREIADRLEVEYKRFLTLHAKHPETTIVPSKEIDKFWHGHILDTMKYAEDCDVTFGYFLHHFPYLGLRGEEDAAQQQLADQETQRLYEQEFGEGMHAQDAAFCSLAAKNDAAFCSLAASKKAAFCSLAAKPQAAFCSLAAKKAAFCSLAAKPRAAFCSLAARPQAAFCSLAAKPKAAFCSLAAKGADLVTRPALALAA
jgi:hypothetical protein